MPRRSTTPADLSAHFGAEPFTVSQAMALGVTPVRIHAAVARGGIRRVARGSYVVAGMADGRQAHLDLARTALLRRPDLILAGVTAAAAWGLPCPDSWGDWASLPLTLACAGRFQFRGGTVLRLDERSWTRHAGLPVTDLVPSALDVAWQLPLANALIVMDAVASRLAGSPHRHLRAAANQRVREMLLTAAEALPRRPGIRKVRTAVAAAHAGADSPPESYLRGHVVAAGLPEPRVNAPVTGASGRGYYIDLFWPDTRLAVEVDGAVKYTDRAVLVAEKRREDDLRAAGISMIRAEAKDVFAHAPLLARDVQEALRLRS